MQARLRRGAARLFEPVDGASLAVLRIVVGLAIAWDAARYWSRGWIQEYYVAPKWTFPLLDLGWPTPWPGDGMFLHFAALAAAALLVALGLFYRVAIVALWALYSYVFLLEKSVYLNHHYLICLLAFVLIWMQPHRVFSLDRLRYPASSGSAPRWNVLLVRFQLAAVYAFGALAKLNPDWLRGEPMFTALPRGELVVPFAQRQSPRRLRAAAQVAPAPNGSARTSGRRLLAAYRS